jgi:N-acetyltransferase
MFDLQPTLTGRHITLRPLAPQDFHELFSVASDPLVWAQHPDPARGTREGFQQLFDGALQSKGCLVAIEAARLIGWSRYHDYAPGERIEIGYTLIARSHWGGAANAEMKRLMLRHAFTDVGRCCSRSPSAICAHGARWRSSAPSSSEPRTYRDGDRYMSSTD